MSNLKKSISILVLITMLMGVLSIPVMSVLAADPAAVGTSSYLIAASIMTGGKEHGFYTNGRYWMFWSTLALTDKVVWSSSTNGTTWAAVDNVSAGTTPSGEIAVCLDSGSVQIAWIHSTGVMAYRKGLLNADGTITWAGAASLSGYTMGIVNSIAKGNDGLLYVSGSVLNAGRYYNMLTASSTSNGTWTTAAGFPILITAGSTVGPGMVTSGVIPYKSGVNVIATVEDGATIFASSKYWNGTDFATSENISTVANTFGYKQVAYGNELYIALNTLFKRYDGAAWSTITCPAGFNGQLSLSLDSTNGIIYLIRSSAATTLSYVPFNINNQTFVGAARTLPAIPANIGSDWSFSGYGSMTSGKMLFFTTAGAGSPYTIYGQAVTAPVVTTDNVSYSINKDGTLSGSFGMTLSDNGTAPALTNAFGYSTLNDAAAPYVYTYTAYAGDNASTVGYKQASFSRTGVTPGFTWYYRAGSDFRGWGAEKSFTLTAPVTTTTAATNTNTNTPTLNGNITSLGNASSVYAYFEYGWTTAYGSSTPLVTENHTGVYGATITHPNWPKEMHYRSVVQVGTAKYYGADVTLTPTTAARTYHLDGPLQVVPIIVFVLVVLAAGVMAVFGWKHGNLLMVALGLVFIAVLIILYPIIIAGIEGILAFIP